MLGSNAPTAYMYLSTDWLETQCFCEVRLSWRMEPTGHRLVRRRNASLLELTKLHCVRRQRSYGRSLLL